jgi:hypothetical protein
MRAKLYACLVLGLAAVSAFAVPTASAATEFGDSCIANEEFTSPATLFEVSSPLNPLPTAAPTAGVITKWTVSVIPVPGLSFQQTMKVLRTSGTTASIVAEEAKTFTGGTNAFASRIPVQAGDRLSLFGPGPEVKTLICDTLGTKNTLGGFPGNGGGVGSSQPYSESATQEYRIPGTAVLEPDADGDGYGDETQDKCPQSASTQVECPVIVLDSLPLAKRSSIVVLVAVNSTAPVSVAGTAQLPKGKKAKLKQVTRNVTAGKVASFTLKFPGSLKKALKQLAPGKKLMVKLTATATNVAGQTSTDRAKVKLKG